MSGFNVAADGDLSRVFFTNSELIDNFTGATLWTWGSNALGRLGDGTTLTRSSPVTVAGGGTTWRQIAFGKSSGGGIKTDGTLWMWGEAFTTGGALGDGTTIAKSSPVTTSGGGTTWLQIACGYRSSHALKTDGSIWGWGINSSGQMGDGTTAVKSSPVSVLGGTTWEAVARTDTAVAAIKTNNTLWTWGDFTSGQGGDGTTVNKSSPVTVAGSIANWARVCGGLNTFGAVTADGKLYMWGDNTGGLLGDGTTINKSSPVTVAGTVFTWKQVATSTSASVGIKLDGTLWSWGAGTTGMLGDGTTIAKSSPVTTSGGGTNWKQVAMSASAGIAIKTDGSLWTWGASGQLGDGTTVARSSPISTLAVAGTWKSIARQEGSASALGAILF